MPATPEVLDEMDIEIPTAPEMNLREGEERFRAGMQVEDARRREVEITELRTQLKRLEGTSLGETRAKFARSPSARRRQIAMRKEIEKLQKQTYRRGDRWEGPCAPCTLINLNPVPLQLFGELQRWTVPAAGSGLGVLNLKFRGRTFPSSYITFSTAHVWMAHTGTQNDQLAGVDTPAMEARHIPPMGLAHQFFSHYVEGAADAQGMGGIIIFEGDIHTLDKRRLDASDRRVWVPKQDITLDGLGDVVYTLEEMLLDDCLAQSLTVQRRFAERTIAEGHRFATSQSSIERNQLNDGHILWHNWALDHGYIEKAMSWASEQLRDSPTTEAVFCPDCQTRQNSPAQFLCSNCNAPFDALKAFLAGKPVSPDRLTVYEGEEWKAIVSETKRRRAKMALLETPTPTAKPAPANKPAAGSRAQTSAPSEPAAEAAASTEGTEGAEGAEK